MSWLFVPSTLISCDFYPYCGFPIRNFFCGKGEDEGKFAFFHDSKYFISENLWYSLKEGDKIYTPVFEDINGRIFWRRTEYIEYNGPVLFYIYYMGGDYVRTAGIIYPIEYYDEENQRYDGDEFHSFDSLREETSPWTFSPRGSIRESGSPITISFYWPRWESDTLLGEYQPKDDAEGIMVFGSQRFIDNFGDYYVRSVNKSNDKYSYGAIVYSSGRWIIGTIDDANGWWEGEEPTKSRSVVFRFTTPQGSTISGMDKIVSFHDYVMGDESQEAYLAEVAIVR